MNFVKKNTFCNNCGKIGHLFHQCKIPITSIGIIALRKIEDNYEVLLIRRKDSLAFVDFMRGKYNLEDKSFLINILEKMTKSEHEMILNNDFDKIWNYLWSKDINNQYKNEEKLSKQKFNKIKEGYYITNEYCKLDLLLEECNINYEEPEWGFPKGRRNYQEKDIMCGLREFEEETGYNKNNLVLINNIIPLEEIFTVSNYKSYKHKYYICLVPNNNEPEMSFQTCEISKIEWMTMNDAIKIIRNYNVEKKNILLELNNLLKTYKLYI